MVFALSLFFRHYSLHPRHRLASFSSVSAQPEPVKEVAVDAPELGLFHLVLKHIADIQKKVTVLWEC